jgi:hypothetical protein
MNTFLRAASNLQSLVIDAQYDSALEPRIESFAKLQLEMLMLRCTPPIGLQSNILHRYWTTQELQDVIRRCPNLSELGINFPPLPITHNLEAKGLADEAPEYEAFAVSPDILSPCHH